MVFANWLREIDFVGKICSLGNSLSVTVQINILIFDKGNTGYFTRRCLCKLHWGQVAEALFLCDLSPYLSYSEIFHLLPFIRLHEEK